MSNHPEAVRFLLERKYPRYTAPVAKAYEEKAMSAHTEAAETVVARELIERFDYESLVDDDDYDDVASDDATRSARVRDFLTEASDYFETLEEMPEEEFLKLYDQARRSQTRVQRWLARRRDAEMFFNLPEARADYGKWRGLAYWTVDETVALTFGKDPAVVNDATMVVGSVGPLPIRCAPLHENSPFLEVYRRWREVISRAYQAGQFGEYITPTGMIEWVTDRAVNHMQIPRAVRRRLIETSANGGSEVEAQLDRALTELDEADKRIEELEGRLQRLVRSDSKDTPHRMDKVYSLIVGMAHDKYLFGGDKERSTTKKVEDALDRANVHVDNDTIRQILATARSELGWAPPARL